MRSKLIAGLALVVCLSANNSAFSEPTKVLPPAALEAESKQDWGKAISIYLDILTKEPNRADLWLRIADIQYRLKNTQGTINAYQHALQITPRDASIYKALADTYSEQKQTQKALSYIIEAIKLQPENQGYIQDKINLANWAHDTKIVLEGYQQMYILTSPKNSKQENLSLLKNILKLQNQLKLYTNAARTNQQIIDLEPKNPLGYKDLADTYINAKDYPNALVAIDKAINAQPQNISFYILKLSIANQLNNTQLATETQQKINTFPLNSKEKVGIYVQQAQILIGQNKLTDALVVYNQALVLDPNNVKLYQDISSIYSRLNDPKHALEAIKKALTLEPSNNDLLKAQAILANWSKDNKLAVQTYNKILEQDKKSGIKQTSTNQAAIYKSISESYAAANDPKNALLAIKKAVALEPRNMDYLKDEAMLASWAKESKLALDSYQKLFELNKTAPAKTKMDSTKILLAIGSLQNELHQYQNAVKTYQQLIQLNPNEVSYYKNLSITYSMLKDPKNALIALEKAITLEPKNIQLLKAKAELANWQKDEKLTQLTYQQILTLDPNDKTAKNFINSKSQKTEGIPNYTPKPQSPVDKAIAESNNAASAHRYSQAANAMKKAIALHPNDATLYKKLSEIYGMANQPRPALEAINRSVALQPNNIDYLRTRGQIASWLHDFKTMEDSYCRILILRPTDLNALENYAHSLSWQKKSDAAVKVYKRILAIYPRNYKIWLEYAELLSWIGRIPSALKALECYCKIKGPTYDYLRMKARVLAQAGRYRSSFIINDPLLATKTNDPYLLSTDVLNLNNSLQVRRAVEQLNRITPPDESLRKVILTPLRSNINVDGVYTWASDTNRVTNIPVAGQYFISPVTSLQILGRYEHAKAAIGSGFETIDGRPTINDESVMVGFTHQFAGIANLNLLAGGLKIQTKNNHGIYNAAADTNLGQTAKFTIQNSYNLYRPYLIPQSPRSISSQIMEQRVVGLLEWQPFIYKYLNVLVSHSDLSDENGYWHVNIWPKARVWNSQYWNVFVGVDADLWRYRRLTTSGYYSPLRFNGYEGTVELYYAYSDNVGLSLSGGLGLQKDETLPHYYFEEDLSAVLFIGIFNDWQLKAKSGYTLRKNNLGQYTSWSSGLMLTRRF